MATAPVPPLGLPDDAAFLAGKQYGKPGGAVGVNADKLHPEFARRLTALIQAAEQATGDKVSVFEGYRDPARQAQLRANYKQTNVTYDGKTYKPQAGVQGYKAGPPGKSEHQLGMAVDIRAGKEPDKFPSGPAYDYMTKHAADYGLHWFGKSDPAHFEIPPTEYQAAASGKALQPFKIVGQPETAVAAANQLAGVSDPQNVSAFASTGKSSVPLPRPRPQTGMGALGATAGSVSAGALGNTSTLGWDPQYGHTTAGETIRGVQSPADYARARLTAGNPANLDPRLMSLGQPANAMGLGASAVGGAIPVVPVPAARNAAIGMIAPGNIDVQHRPVYFGNDGSYGTERSFSIGTDKGEVLIPQIVNGKLVSQDEAIKHYQQTGENLGTFKTPEAADAYAEQLHQRDQGLGAMPVPMPGRPAALGQAAVAPTPMAGRPAALSAVPSVAKLVIPATPPAQTIRVGKHDYVIGQTFDQGGRHYIVTPSGIESSSIPTGEPTVMSGIIGSVIKSEAPKIGQSLNAAAGKATHDLGNMGTNIGTATTRLGTNIGNTLGSTLSGAGNLFGSMFNTKAVGGGVSAGGLGSAGTTGALGTATLAAQPRPTLVASGGVRTTPGLTGSSWLKAPGVMTATGAANAGTGVGGLASIGGAAAPVTKPVAVAAPKSKPAPVVAAAPKAATVTGSATGRSYTVGSLYKNATGTYKAVGTDANGNAKFAKVG